MARYLNNQKYQRRYLGNTKLKKKYLGETNVWSGGSVVSYYNGTTLLGTREVDEGADVLHDTGFTPTKTNYTFIGWASEPDGTRFETLVATGEPMSLYALFVPNEFVVFTSTVDNFTFNGSTWNYRYTENIIEEGHISGTRVISVQAHWSTQDSSVVSFSTSKGNIYRTLTVEARPDTPNDSAWLVLDGTSSNLTRVLEDGTHTLQAACSSDGDWHNVCVAHIASITLSNPTQWV